MMRFTDSITTGWKPVVIEMKAPIIERPAIMLRLDPDASALILIDLQKGVVGRALAPYTAEQVLKTAKELADRFRSAGATVVPVNVGFSKDCKDALRQPVDQPMAIPPGGFPAEFSELVEGVARPGDMLITKRQWSAFYGTELDLQLRRRGVNTILLGGVSTNIGVESTARQAWELGYHLIIAEDATSGFSAEMHDFAFRQIFPRISRVVKSADLAFR
jgi:nicotinamidase-related amidase